MREKRILSYGFRSIKTSPIFGIGPDNLESKMAEYFKNNSINISSKDHLHNDYIDISAKFGLPALIFLLLIYFSIYKNIIGNDQSVSILLLVVLLSSHLTQSQFAHHQIISFLISIIFCYIKYSESMT